MLQKVLKTTVKTLVNSQRRFNSNVVLTEKLEDIFIITINRPNKRNCVNKETSRLLLQAFQEFENDKHSKVAILCGKGGNFCAGYDLEEITKSVTSGEEIKLEKGPMGPSLLVPSKPTIAAIDGYAVGGGLELALMCDLRICEENSVLGVFNRRFGVPLIDGGSVRLPKIVGLTRALDLILTGRKVSAKEAMDIGLVVSVTEVGTVLGNAVTLAQCLRKFPQECLLADRRSVYYSVFEANSLDDAFRFETENGFPIVAKEGFEGAKKFVESGVGRHGKFQLHSIDELLARKTPKLV